MNLTEELQTITELRNEELEYLKQSKLPLVLYGAAECGRFMKIVLDDNKIKIDYVVVDKEYWQPDMKFFEHELLPLEVVLENKSQMNIIFAFFREGVLERMAELSKRPNVNKCLLFDIFPPFNFVNHPIEPLEELYRRFADDISRRTMLEFMRAKNLMTAKELMKLNVPNELGYFPDFLPLSDCETFVDCGAYTGDTIENFLQKTNGKFNKIFAFEPDPSNIEKCKETIAKIEGRENITLIEKGVYKEKKTLYFNNQSNGGSSICESGNSKIEVDSIDNVCKNEKVTFIKMDIEGAELDALKGAQNTIMQNKPKLAICVYHKKEDLTTIPQYILSLNPEYKLYLRHYGPFCTELVLYAV